MTTSSSITTRKLGKDGPETTRLGLGLMNLSWKHPKATSTSDALPQEAERLEFLNKAYEAGERFWDTADEYGDSEDLLGRWFAANPNKRKDVFVASKFGIRHAENGPRTAFRVDSTPEYCRAAIEKTLKRLGLPFIDLYYVHRLDKVTPIEKTVEAMVELKTAGKIKYIGLSECSAESLRRAHAIHPITCVQVEYSLFCLEIESPHTRLLEAARELGVAVVCYSPLGMGVLGGSIRAREDVLKPGDLRGLLPFLSEEHFPGNISVVQKFISMAEKKGITTAQLALAWLLAQGDDIFPIPGTTNIDRLLQNLGSLSVSLSQDEIQTMRNLNQSVNGGRWQTSTGFAFADTPAL